jgi:hypothetical protein
MADSKESFEILENASGDGVSPTASEAGFTATGKVGMTVFGFKDSSGNLVLPATAITVPATTDPGIVVRPIDMERPTFTVLSVLTAVANNKSMIAIQNTGTSVVRIKEIWVINDRTTNTNGVIGTFEARRITSFTGGTSLTPVSYDTADSLPSGITAATGSTVSGESSLLKSLLWSTDEWGVKTTSVESSDHTIQNGVPFWKQTPGCKALTIRQNQGIHIKFATNSTNGDFNLCLVFTTEG